MRVELKGLHTAAMEPRVWVNRHQPQTLYIAQLLLYFHGLVAMVVAMLGTRSLGLVSLALAVGSVAAAFGIANERRWGYRLGVVAAVVPVALLVLFAVIDTPRWLWRDPLDALFDVALVALLLYPTSRDYQRHWPRKR